MKDTGSLLASILSRIRPDEEEKLKLKEVSKEIIDRINNLGDKEGLNIKGQLVGSAARGTWLSGEHDLDIFIMFPPDVERIYLEEKGLYVARRIAREAEKYEERYAEHPYINAVFYGFEVDLVPAFSVQRASEIRSAVDRTPFHSEYVSSRIKGLEDEVLLLKQFMKGAGVYGSELKTQGFSGYLVELLTIRYCSFIDVLEEACLWEPGIVIDLENHGSVIHDEPVVVIDPTDPARNVAAALSLDNMCIFIDRAREFLKYPDEYYFSEPRIEPLDDEEFRKILHERGTALIALEFNAPDVVEDVLYPQLYKMEESVLEMMERFDFRVYNSAVWADKKAIVLFELESSGLPSVKKHAGPMVWTGDHALAFKSKYKNEKTFSNVYIRNGKYMLDIPRKYANAKKLLESETQKCSLGKHLAMSIQKDFHILEDDEILNVEGNGFRKFLRKFFEK